MLVPIPFCPLSITYERQFLTFEDLPITRHVELTYSSITLIIPRCATVVSKKRDEMESCYYELSLSVKENLPKLIWYSIYIRTISCHHLISTLQTNHSIVLDSLDNFKQDSFIEKLVFLGWFYVYFRSIKTRRENVC